MGMFKSIINDQGSITTRFIFNITQCEADSFVKAMFLVIL